MKKSLCIVLTALTLLSVLILGSCGGNGNSSSETQPTESATAETKPNRKKTNELKDYEASFVKGKSPIYGTWKLSGLDYMYIVFRNDNLAELAMGSEGYLSKYKFDKKTKTLTVQLLPGTIDGKYSYEFSEKNTKLTLTLDGNTLELTRDNSYSMIPTAPKEAVIDEGILGWWENSDGMIYYFGEDGLMYNNAIARETYYTYIAANNKIAAVYNYGGDMNEELSYKLRDGILVIDGEEYTKKTNV